MSLAHDARTLFEESLRAILPAHTLPNHVYLHKDALHVANASYPLAPQQRLYCFGSGKAAHTMAEALLQTLGERVCGGLIVSPHGGESIGPLRHLNGAHPIPDHTSLTAGEALLEAMGSLRPEDSYIYLLSGGSSALIEALQESITLEDLQATTRVLLSHNLPITTINAVRKRLSRIKGGGLSGACPAKGVVLVVSDVIGDDLHTIGSAPLMDAPSATLSLPDEVVGALPKSVQRCLNATVPQKAHTSPPHHLIATNRLALEAAKEKALALGYTPRILTDSLDGLAEEVAARIYKEIASAPPKSCFLYGGEPTVQVTGTGKGGRNQHVALAFLTHLDTHSPVALLSAGTDGVDGNSPAAGAYADKHVLSLAQEAGLTPRQFLKACDAHTFFKQTKSTITTGPTGTNVMDILIALKE
jgi:hydroxypyruvate reductase/glycerate 2-kinase